MIGKISDIANKTCKMKNADSSAVRAHISESTPLDVVRKILIPCRLILIEEPHNHVSMLILNIFSPKRFGPKFGFMHTITVPFA